MLPPHELEVLAPGEVLLDGVVRALDEHGVEPDPLLQVRHRRRQAERVDRPAHAAKESVISDTVVVGYMWYYRQGGVKSTPSSPQLRVGVILTDPEPAKGAL